MAGAAPWTLGTWITAGFIQRETARVAISRTVKAIAI